MPLLLLIPLLALLLSACTPAGLTPAAAPNEVPSATPVPRLQIVPSWTPTEVLPPTATPTRRPTNTQPSFPTPTPFTLPGTPQPVSGAADAPFIGDAWLERPLLLGQDQPALLSLLRYNPIPWQPQTASSALGLGYLLDHRFIPGCAIEGSEGAVVGGQQSAEVSSILLGEVLFDTTLVSEAGALVSVTYCSSDEGVSACFDVRVGDDAENCLNDAREALSTFEMVFNPNLDVTPHVWNCLGVVEGQTDAACLTGATRQANALAFAGPDNPWVAGQGGALLVWNGREWRSAHSPTTASLTNVAFAAADDGWAVGEGAIILRWNGLEWSEFQSYTSPGRGPGGATITLNSLALASPVDGWAVGGQVKGSDVEAYILHWDGQAWSPVTERPACDCTLEDVAANGPADVWAVGGGNEDAVAMHWDGIEWRVIEISDATRLFAVNVSAEGEVWAAGYEQAVAPLDFATGFERGVVLRWNGERWDRYVLPPQQGRLYAVAGQSGGDAVCGGDSTYFRADRRWQRVAFSLGFSETIVDIALDPEGQAWGLTLSGKVFRLDNTLAPGQ